MKVLLISPLPPPVGGIASWTVNLLNYNSSKPDSCEIIHQNTSLRYGGITKEDIHTRIFLGFNEFKKIYLELRKYIFLLLYNLKAESALQKSFWILILGMMLNDIAFVLVWVFFFQSFIQFSSVVRVLIWQRSHKRIPCRWSISC